ncbi:ABC transporter permease [Geomesophilobacter sediminis]|uniref:ABC transporter permease n=1 Tax=Geomesophilobacter sediminis TaxID=2798584 RepID=A0A8J7JCA2_9BACT|nr:ABC transporter permease [Geomesophilobacter sediminis]MBJ6724373.1 ABC transporter permease [Geomesophilobacter sediminis]
MAEIELEYLGTTAAAAPPKPLGPKRARRLGFSYLLPLVIPLVLLVLWELLSRRGLVRPTILPAPSAIGATARELVASGELIHHLLVSLWRVTKGVTLGAGFGLVAGLVVGLNPWAERAVSLITGVLRPIPIIAWVPVLILWMGIDEGSKITVIAIGSFWPVLLNVVHGIRNTDRKILEVAKVFQKSRATLLFKVVLPAALPSIFTGMRIGIGIAWMSVVGAELIAASAGVGYLIMYARELSQADVMLVGVVSIGVTGLAIDFLIRRLERRLLRWNANLQ